MEVSRWKNVWSFLSLSVAQRLSSALWLPGVVEAHIAEIRGLLRNLPFYGDPEVWQAALVDLFRAVDPQLSVDAEMVFIWGEYLFVHQGPDRAAETVWNLVPYWMRDSRIDFYPRWMLEIVEQLREEQDKLRLVLKQELVSIRNEPLDVWDAERISVCWEERGLEFILDKIELIATYNIFVRSWETHCSKLNNEEARLFYDAAVELARKNKMPVAVAYPPSWRIPIGKFLEM